MSEALALIRFLKTNLGLPFTPIIAGGFARDQVLGVKARDIDVFLLADSNFISADNKSVNDMTNMVVDFLTNHYVQHVVEPKLYATPTDGIPAFGPPINFQFLQWPVQLVCTPCTSPEDVVGSFDYNVCQYWIGEDGHTIGLADNYLEVLVHRNMRLLHTRTPWSSLRRGILMADRFGFNFLEQDRRRLIEALHAELTS
jgi:hypothetical protein